MTPSSRAQVRFSGQSDAIVAVATDGAAMDQYWVRCLPHDFPGLRMTAHAEAGNLCRPQA